MKRLFFIRFVSIMILGIIVFLSEMPANAQNVTITDDDGYSPDENAMLDVKSVDKGMLVPRVALISTTSPISGTIPVGLLVWNTSTSGLYPIPGFYFWNGSNWEMIGGSTSYDFWTHNGNSVYLTDTTENLGIGVINPGSKLEIKGDVSGGDEDPIFEVKNKYGQVMFGVYNEGVRVFVNEESKGGKAGFAVAKVSTGKAIEEYLRVTPDSVRIYINEDIGKGGKAGFAVAKVSTGKAGEEYMRVTPDSVRIYIDENTGKGGKAGFAVAKVSTGKSYEDFLSVTSDSTRVYVNGDGGFAVDNIAAGSEGRFVDLTPENYLIGHYTGANLIDGKYNTFIGYEAGLNTIGTHGLSFEGSNNIFLGYQSGYSNSYGFNNICIGNNAGYNLGNGGNNICIGDGAGKGIVTGGNNICIGAMAGDLTTGTGNIYIGTQTGSNTGGAVQNTYIGQMSGTYTNGGNNTILGAYALVWGIDGSENVIIGDSTASRSWHASQNVIIGRKAGGNSITDARNGSVFLGYKAGYWEAESNKLYIENSDDVTPLIYGDFSTDSLVFNGDVYIDNRINEGGSRVLLVDGDGEADDIPFRIRTKTDPTTGLTDANTKFIVTGTGLVGIGTGATLPECNLEITHVGDVTLLLDADNNNNGEGDNPRLEIRQDGGGVVGALGLEGDNYVLYPNSRWNGMYLINEYTSPLQLGTNGYATVNIKSNKATGTVEILPLDPNGSSQLCFAEDSIYNDGMSIHYDGSTDFMEIYGKSGALIYGPHLRIDKSTGSIYMPNIANLTSSTWLTINTTNGLIGYSSSSVRYKKNIDSIKDIDWLYDLNPVSFNYKADETNELQYGLIAEEVNEINKNLVLLNKDGEIETVAYPKLISPMLKALQDQNNRINKLEEQNKNISEENEELKQSIQDLNQKVEELYKLINKQ
ncbi:MAG: tail fiber domain-containing protein [Bacteroidales bacterium]|nr:tail fiber domain-containing protein [Bacteroidales bacterium]